MITQAKRIILTLSALAAASLASCSNSGYELQSVKFPTPLYGWVGGVEMVFEKSALTPAGFPQVTI
jgi:hypothetical protein